MRPSRHGLNINSFMLAICKPEILPNLVLCVPALQLSDTNLCLLLEQKQTAVLCGQQHPEATGFSEPPVTSVPKMTQQTGLRHTWWTLETSDAGPSAAWLQTLKSCQINTYVIFHISGEWPTVCESFNATQRVRDLTVFAALLILTILILLPQRSRL